MVSLKRLLDEIRPHPLEPTGWDTRFKSPQTAGIALSFDGGASV